jgi:hypothetical protein
MRVVAVVPESIASLPKQGQRGSASKSDRKERRAVFKVGAPPARRTGAALNGSTLMYDSRSKRAATKAIEEHLEDTDTKTAARGHLDKIYEEKPAAEADRLAEEFARDLARGEIDPALDERALRKSIDEA